MANLLFLDSVDHYADSDTLLKYLLCQATVDPGGRTNNCLKLSSSGAQVWIYKALASKVTGKSINPTLTIGCAYKAEGLAQPMMKAANAISGLDSTLYGYADGRLNFAATGAGASAATASVLTVGNWYYVEFQAEYGVTLGSAWVRGKIRVNNDLLLDETLTGVPLAAAAERGWSYFGIGSGPLYGLASYVDDIYVTDGEFLGDVRIYVIRPNAPGDESIWTPVGAASDWQATKDITPDYATTYVYAGSPGDRMLVNLENIAVLGPIKGLQANFVATKSDAGLASFNPRYKISGSYFDSLAEFFPSWQAWIDFVDAYRKNPITGNDWTVAEINAMQQGMTRTT